MGLHAGTLCCLQCVITCLGMALPMVGSGFSHQLTIKTILPKDIPPTPGQHRLDNSLRFSSQVVLGYVILMVEH